MCLDNYVPNETYEKLKKKEKKMQTANKKLK